MKTIKKVIKTKKVNIGKCVAVFDISGEELRHRVFHGRSDRWGNREPELYNTAEEQAKIAIRAQSDTGVFMFEKSVRPLHRLFSIEIKETEDHFEEWEFVKERVMWYNPLIIFGSVTYWRKKRDA